MSMSSSTDVVVQEIRAIALTVSDVDRLKDFYMRALGFEPIADFIVEGRDYSHLEGIAVAKIRIVTLRLGDELIELIQYLNVAADPIPSDSQSDDLWFQHLAIVVSDIDRAYQHLQSFLIQPISTEPQTIPVSNQASAGVRAFKFKDPDCHDLELIWFPPDKGQAKWHQNDENRLFLGIDHSAIAIANTEQSLNFYHNLLGMKVDGGSLNQGTTQAHLDGLPEATVKVTALRPIQGDLGIELLDYLAPTSGRSIPKDWNSASIAHWQVELVVNNLEQMVERLQQAGASFVSNGIVQLENSSVSHCQACLVKDPTGHAMLLMTESPSKN